MTVAELPDVDRFIGLMVKARRLELGLSQPQLAERIDVSFQQVQKYENGKNRISAATLVRIAYALCTPPGHFLDGAPGAPGAALDVDSLATLYGQPDALECLRSVRAMTPARRALAVQVLKALADR